MRVDAAVDARTPDAFAILKRLVVALSTVGQEQAAQAPVGEEFRRRGFAVTHLPVPPAMVQDPVAGAHAYARVAELGTPESQAVREPGRSKRRPAVCGRRSGR